MRSVYAGILAILLVGVLTGCARFPAANEATAAPPQTLYAEIDVVGQINPNEYYFFAVNFDPNNIIGPVPVVTGPEYSNGWGTLSGLSGGQVQIPPFYVEYYNNTFIEYYGNGQVISQPYNCGVSGNRLWVEIDTRLFTSLMTSDANKSFQANWITMDYIDPPNNQLKQYDSMQYPPYGFLNTVTLSLAQVYTSGVNGIPAQPTYGNGQETASDENLDIQKWDIEVRNNATSGTTTTP